MPATKLTGSVLAVTLLVCATADSQLFPAYLAANGNDANPCMPRAPCRLLPAAVNAVASGREIRLLDSAQYDTATVGVTDSAISRGSLGAHASSLANTVVRIVATRSTIERTGFGLASTSNNVGTTSIAVSNSMLANNTGGWKQEGSNSSIETRGTTTSRATAHQSARSHRRRRNEFRLSGSAIFAQEDDAASLH